MKTVAVFLLFFTIVTVSFSFTENELWMEYESISEDGEWFYVPQIDGTLRLMHKKQIEFEYKNSPQPRSGLVVTFHLYTKLNSDVPQFINENSKSSLLESNFDPRRPTKIVTHGWNGHLNSTLNRLVRPALLETGDYNVIIVDWSSAAVTVNYISARYKVPVVAERIANLIEFLQTSGGMKLEDLTLIGHSLGAHASGLAAKKVRKGKVRVIIGLDPAQLLFFYKIPGDRLSRDDAEYVQTIHTNGGYLSFHKPIGQASFYPNWGATQPGCGFDATGRCSHRRSYEYFAESLYKNNSFIPFKCSEYSNILQKKCGEMDMSARMGGVPAEYGYPKGIFYIPTKSEKPFAMGACTLPVN